MTGTIKRIERGNAIVESGRIEAVSAARPDDPEGEPPGWRPGARFPVESGPQQSWTAARAVACRSRIF